MPFMRIIGFPPPGVRLPLVPPELLAAEEGEHGPRLLLQLGHRLHLDVEPHGGGQVGGRRRR